MRTPLVLLAAAACTPDTPPEGVGGEEGPVYVMMTQVYSVDDGTVYLALTDSLDVDEISLDEARELGGVANFAGVGGRLLVSDGEQPVITAHDITADLQWEEREAVSFANYPLYDNANFYYHFLVDEHTAYLPFETTRRILWDPTDMVIVGTREDSALALEKGGLTL